MKVLQLYYYLHLYKFDQFQHEHPLLNIKNVKNYLQIRKYCLASGISCIFNISAGLIDAMFR